MDWLVHVPDQGGLVTTDHRLFYTWMLFTQASLLGRCFCQSALVLHYTTKYHHRTMQLYNCTLYHEISSQNYATIQLYIFTTVYPVLRHVLFAFSFTNVTLPKYVSIRQGQDEQIDIIVTDMVEMVARNCRQICSCMDFGFETSIVLKAINIQTKAGYMKL